MITNLDAYLEAIKADYLSIVEPGNTIQEEMYRDFCDGLTYSAGSKYIKVFKDRKGGCSVHSFICLKDDAKFKKGDILAHYDCFKNCSKFYKLFFAKFFL